MSTKQQRSRRRLGSNSVEAQENGRASVNGHRDETPTAATKLAKGDIIEITWKDSHAIYGWHELEDLTPSVIVSVGYVLKEEEDHVVLVSSNSDSANHFTALSIPPGCICDTSILKKAERSISLPEILDTGEAVGIEAVHRR